MHSHPRKCHLLPSSAGHRTLPITKPCSCVSNGMRTDSWFSRFGGIKSSFKLEYLLIYRPRYHDSVHREPGVMVGSGKGKKRKDKREKKEKGKFSLCLRTLSYGGWIKGALISFFILSKTLAPIVGFQNVEWVQVFLISVVLPLFSAKRGTRQVAF